MNATLADLVILAAALSAAGVGAIATFVILVLFAKENRNWQRIIAVGVVALIALLVIVAVAGIALAVIGKEPVIFSIGKEIAMWFLRLVLKLATTIAK